MSDIPDFTDTEVWTITSTLKERYGEDVPLQQADTEIRLSPGARELTLCPAVYWEHGDVHFIIIKTGEQVYRCQFFYRLHQMFGTGIPEYDDLTECVVSVLQVQVDHQAKQAEEQQN